MSRFGTRVAIANQMIDQEFGDLFDYMPMHEVVNASPEPDNERYGGRVRAVLLLPGQTLGSGWSLNGMHERSSAEPHLYYMARGLLTDVQRFDRFSLASTSHNPDRTGTRVYEVGDVKHIGFGRYNATLVEISVGIRPYTAAQTVDEDGIPW